MDAVAGSVAPVNAAVLRWAREAAGLDIEEAAEKIHMPVSKLREAEAGERWLTMNQARKAADAYDRPFAVFFLPNPPIEEPLEMQFRRLRDAPALPWKPSMRSLARRVPALQEEAEALFDAIEEPPTWPKAAELFRSTDDLVLLGERLRELVGVPLELQKDAAKVDQQGYRVFRVWREAIESLGILVLQDGTLPLDEMRGFASPGARVPAVVINTNDNVRARLFTMLHELSHILSAEPSEARSDEFAGVTLMPPIPFGVDFEHAPGASLLERIDSLARTYGTTSDATAVRAGWYRLATWDEVGEVREAIRGRSPGARPAGGNHYRNVIARMGPGFVGRVLDAVGQSAVSELTGARILGVRVEAFDRLRRELTGADVA